MLTQLLVRLRRERRVSAPLKGPTGRARLLPCRASRGRERREKPGRIRLAQLRTKGRRSEEMRRRGDQFSAACKTKQERGMETVERPSAAERIALSVVVR